MQQIPDVVRNLRLKVKADHQIITAQLHGVRRDGNIDGFRSVALLLRMGNGYFRSRRFQFLWLRH